MKNNIKAIIGSAIIGLAFMSCSDFLDESPYSELTNENWGSGDKNKATEYTKGEQMEQLLTGVYSDFNKDFWQLDWYMMNDGQSDNAYAGEAKDPTMQIDELRIVSTNINATRDWGVMYGQIAQANTIIEWIPKINDPLLTAQRKAEIDGEAHFLRALFYFNLVRIYGRVPLIVNYIPEISLENIDEIYPLLYPAQAEIVDIYTQIIKDLEYADKNVSEYSAYKFKATKALVNLILAEVYATKDGFAKTDWNKVKTHASVVVNNSNYGLMDKYDDLFAVSEAPANGSLPATDLTNEHCKESLFEVNYSKGALSNWAASMFYGVDWKKFNTPSQDLYKAFNNAGDIVRRDASIMFADVTGRWSDKYWPTTKYPYCYKMRARESGNIVLFRYAEALLLLADAENELGNIVNAKTLLNKVRARVNLAPTTANSKENIRLAIENEHRLEFAFEGKRWMDLKRRGRFIQVMHASTDHQNEYALRLNENKLVWPIPQSEIELNENLVQNIGY